MNALVLRVLVLGNALLLALPAGWCCTVPALNAAPAPEKPQSCCSARHKIPRSPAKPCPPLPCKSCCDQHTKAVRPQSVKAPTDPGYSAPVAVFLTDISAAGHDGPARAMTHAHSPPPALHVLQCVWRC